MKSVWRVFLGLAALFLAGSAWAQDGQGSDLATPDASPGETQADIPPVIPTEHFAANGEFRDMELSPDGSKFALVRVTNNQSELLVLGTATKSVQNRLRLPKGSDIKWALWAGDDKVVMSVVSATDIYGVEVRASRLLVKHLDDSGTYFLKVDGGVYDGDDIIHLDDAGEFVLVSVQRNRTEYPSVYRYELKPDGKRDRILRSKPGVWDWYADETGVVRIGMGWYYGKLRVYYRPDEDSSLELVNKIKPAEEGGPSFWTVVRIVSGSSQGYILADNADGRKTIQLFDFVAGEVVNQFYEHPQWDIDRVWLRPNGEPLAAFYTDDREQVVWFDEEMERTYGELKRALGQEIRFLSRSDDNNQMMIWAGNEADPGAYYIFSPTQRKLDVFANTRPELDFRALARPKPVAYEARDGLKIQAYLTLPRGRVAEALPLIIMPHGGPYGVRDKLRYNDEVQFFANRGYAVLQPNYRGSSGYGEDFEEAGRGEIGRRMQDDVDDAMDWAVGEGIADPDRVCVVGGSYGGYAALWAVLRNPERYRCAASWAGVTDWDTLLKYDGRFFSISGGKKWRERVEGDDGFDLNTVSPVSRAGRLSRPVLLAHGTEDRTVPIWQYEAFERASRKAPVPPTTLVLEGEGHGFSSTENEQAWYDALTAFMAEHNPADTPASPDTPSQ